MQRPREESTYKAPFYQVPALAVRQPATAQAKIPAIWIAAHRVAIGARSIAARKQEIRRVQFSAGDKRGELTPHLWLLMQQPLHYHLTGLHYFFVRRVKRARARTYDNFRYVYHFVPEWRFEPYAITTARSFQQW